MDAAKAARAYLCPYYYLLTLYYWYQRHMLTDRGLCRSHTITYSVFYLKGDEQVY